MGELKTRPTDASVKKYIDAIADEGRRRDCRALVKIMRKAAGAPPKMWGESIVGFGSYHYVYASGQEGDWPVAAFSPRKQNLTVYCTPGFTRYAGLMKKLGPYKTGVSCLYLRSLDEVHIPSLEKLVTLSVRDIKAIVAERRKAAKKSRRARPARENRPRGAQVSPEIVKFKSR